MEARNKYNILSEDLKWKYNLVYLGEDGRIILIGS
jgi:hypothetical protein